MGSPVKTPRGRFESLVKMSFVIRRGVSTLVPPKVANPSGLGAAANAQRMARIAKFYEQLQKDLHQHEHPVDHWAGIKRNTLARTHLLLRSGTSFLALWHWVTAWNTTSI